MSHVGLADGTLLLSICDKVDKKRSHVLLIHASGPADEAFHLLKLFVESQCVVPLTYPLNKVIKNEMTVVFSCG